MRLKRILVAAGIAVAAYGQTAVLEDGAIRVEVRAPELSVQFMDKKSGTVWQLSGPQAVLMDKRVVPARLVGELNRTAKDIRYRTNAGLEFELRLGSEAGVLEYSFHGSLQPFGAPEMDDVLLFQKSLATGPAAGDYYALPNRLGIQLRPEGDAPAARRMNAYNTGRGYSMNMMGAVKGGSALLVSWDSIETDVLVEYSGAPDRVLTAGLAMRGAARRARIQVLGKGGYVEIAKAYRELARQRGLLETIPEKLKRNSATASLIGAADFKPFTLYHWVPNTPYNKTDKERVTSNFSFEEVAQLAEHYRRDLDIDRAMVVVGGWITGGYDGSHPDVLPAAAESGGNEQLAKASDRIKKLGYLFGLHDNYTDFYRGAPSWDEDYIAKGADGSLVKGGVWAGGQAYLNCQRRSLDLAKRPQNIPGVFDLFRPDVFFIDCLYAMVPRVCEDPKHPVSKTEDVALKLELADYARSRPALFGSEEGNESGVAHADYFEGILGHKTRSHTSGAETVIPLFEIVFGDSIPMLTHQSERLGPDNPEQFLDHVLYAEMPVYRFGVHQYWKDAAGDFKPAAGSEARLVFAQGERWGLYDRLIRNTYEVLSHLARLTAAMPMTDHRFLTPDRTVESTRFGQEVEVTVNYGAADYETGGVVLPQYGFLVKSPRMLAFYARRYLNTSFEKPAYIVLRSGDSQQLTSSSRILAYRGFGEGRLEFGGGTLEIPETGKTIEIRAAQSARNPQGQ